jgi:hypothetical protein
MVDYFDHIHAEFQARVHERYGPDSVWNRDLPEDEKDVRVLHKGRVLLLMRCASLGIDLIVSSLFVYHAKLESTCLLRL